MSATDAQLQRWRAPLLWVSLGLFAFGALSGIWLFFFGGFIDARARLGLGHWLLSLALLGPCAIYLLRHWLRVRGGAGGRAHYRVGLAAFFAIVVVLLSGLPLILWPPGSGGTWGLVNDLAHVVSSFVLVILLVAHLVLVTRVTLGRGGSNTASALFGARTVRLALIVPLALGLLATVLLAV
ncbi:MAG: hypothetical protein U1F11_03795 [Steroidobacteraceae bacterium]